MGTLLKYIFYIVLIVVIFLIAKGIYDGQITQNSTVGQVGSDIAQGTEKLMDKAKTALNEKQEKNHQEEMISQSK